MPGFLSLSYWFAFFPPALLPAVQIMFAGVFVVLIGAGLIFFYVLRKNATSKLRKQTLGTMGAILAWAGISGLMWLLMTVTGVPILGMRLWLILGAGLFGWLFFRSFRVWTVTIPAQEQGAVKRDSYEKWLPKPKK